MASPVVFEFSNGLTVIVEEMETVKSAAYSLTVPCGVLYDEAGRVGTSLILTELSTKGAGEYDSRKLSEAFDSIGARHSESAGMYSSSYSGSLLAENLESVLRLVSLMVTQPRFPEADIDPIKSLLAQDVRALLDNPSRRVMHELGLRYYPAPFNRPSVGIAEDLEKTGLADIKKLYSKSYTPRGAILSVAGNVKAAEVKKVAERFFGGWQGIESPVPSMASLPKRSNHHIESDAAQLQVALAYPSVKFAERFYYASRVMSDVLSGGMFGRLFIEVREKRGLCYSVYSGTSSTKLSGVTMAYAGTTPDRAQETLDVMLDVLRGVKGTVTDEELKRSKANIKASLIMSEESSSARAGANANDWWWLKRIRSLDEIKAGIEAVSQAEIDEYASEYPCQDLMVVTLGSRKLEVKV